MDDLRDQLRRLGEAAEADVAPIEPSGFAVSTRIDSDEQVVAVSGAGGGGNRRLLSRRALLGAAAALLVVFGSLAFVTRPMPEDDVGITSAQAGSTQWAVPQDDNGWADLRACESKSDYSAESGNTFFGAYQFNGSSFRETAQELGLTEYMGARPSTAPPEVQDAVANALYLERGSDAWPICGRFLRGPMITPVIPQWLSASNFIRFAGSTAVFIEPDLPATGPNEILAQIQSVIAGSSLTSVEFVSQAQSFEEFQAMFADDEQIRESVSVQDMPPRFEISGTSTAPLRQQLSEIPGVFEVIDAIRSPRINAGDPLHISVPALSLDEPVHPLRDADQLHSGVTALGTSAQHVLLGGFGSVENSVFEQIGELRSGDLVTVSSLISDDDRTYELSERFVVQLPAGQDTPVPMSLDEIAPLTMSSAPGLLLVADVAGDATLRWVVPAVPTEPDLTRYEIADEES